MKNDTSFTSILILLCFTDNSVFYKLLVCGHPVSCKSGNATFPMEFAYFVSLCHILIFLRIFQAFSLLLCLSW